LLQDGQIPYHENSIHASTDHSALRCSFGLLVAVLQKKHICHALCMAKFASEKLISLEIIDAERLVGGRDTNEKLRGLAWDLRCNCQ
jgi:hypothetical protein